MNNIVLMQGRRFFQTALIFNLFLRILSITVFALLPVCVVQLAVRRIERIEVEKIVLSERLLQERILTKLRVADDNERMIARALIRMFGKISAEESAFRRVKALNRLNRAFPNAFDWFVFDKQGRLDKRLSSDSRPKRAAELTFATMKKYARGEKVSQERRGLVISFLKASALPLGIGGTGITIKLANRARDASFLWLYDDSSENCALGGFIAFIHPEAFVKDRALQNSVTQVNRRLYAMQTGYVEFQSNSSMIFPELLRHASDIRSRLLLSIGRYDKHFASEEYHGTYIPREQSGYLLALSKKPRFFKHGTVLLIDFFCLIWFLIALKKSPDASKGIDVRIPIKLVGFFLFAIGTPSVILLVGGYYALNDHALVMRQELESHMNEKFRHFDERMPAELQRIKYFVGEIISEARQYDNLDDQLKIFEKFRSEKILDHVFLSDQNGNSLFSYRENMSDTAKRQTQFIRLLARELLKRLNKSLVVDSGSLMAEATEGVFSSLVGDEGKFDLDLISRDLGNFILLKLGAEGVYIYFDALYDEKGDARYALTVIVQRPRLERHYIESNIGNLSRQDDLPWKVNAIGYPGFVGKVITTPELRKQAIEVADEVMLKRSSVRMVIPGESADILWYGQPGTNLSNFILVACCSLETLDRHVNLLWLGLISLAALILLSTAYIGLLISRHFLQPVENLASGIKAIERRDFKVQIPVFAGDELGGLSILMNSVIQGMQDLELAGIVQTNLFPGNPLQVGEYKIYGKSKPISDIGGDYFDYFMFDDRRILGLVGDVSGHGVSAALIMGMAKHAFSNPANAGIPLEEIMTSFNFYLLGAVQKKKMMTLFFFSVDTVKNTLEYCNAGHNYPFMWLAGEKRITQIAQASFPLGIRPKAEYFSETVVLNKGDSILFFTDSLVESCDRNGEAIDYETAGSWFSGFVELDPEEVVARMFSRFEETVSGGCVSDDTSIICLKRK